MKTSKLFLILPLLLAFPFKAGADLPTAQFLLQGQGPRAEAMGEAVVSNSSDYTAWYWNPAGAAFVRNPQLGFNSENITQNDQTSYLSFIYPLKRCSFGAQALSENASVAAYDNAGQQLPAINNQNMLASIGFAYAIRDWLSVGLGVGQVSMSLGGYNTNAALNVNIGALYKKYRFSAAVDVANIGDNLKFGQSSEAESQPMLVRYGVSYSFLRDKSLLCSISAQDVPQSAALSSYGGGVEYLLCQYLALRGGILNQNNYMRLCSGFGIAYKHIGIDVSYTLAPEELQGLDTIQIGLSYKFGRLEQAVKQEAPPAESKPAAKQEQKPKSPEIPPAETKPEQEQMPISPAASPAQNNPIPKGVNLAVAEFGARNVSASDALIVSDFLRTELVNLNLYNVIEKANMDKILAEASFQMSGCTTSDCVVQLGKILNVQEMVVGSLAKLTDTYYVTVSVVDVQTGKILVSFSQDAPAAKDLQNACHIIAEKMAHYK